MAVYQLFVGAAAFALVAGMMHFRGRLKSLLVLLCFTSAVLLFALRATNDFNLLVSVSIVLCFCLLGGAVYLASNLVREIAETLNLQTGLPIARHIAWLWLPLVGLFVLAWFAANWTHEWAAGKLYSIENSAWNCKNPNFFLCHEDPEGSFKGNLHLTSHHFFQDANSAVHDRIAKLRVLPLSTEPAFRKSVNDALFESDPVIPKELFERMDGCSVGDFFWRPLYCIKALIVNPVYDAYESFRRKLGTDLDNSIAAEFRQAETMANLLANVVYLNLDRQLQRARESVDRNIDRAFFVRDALSFFSLFAAILLLVKILLYILVRFVFEESTAKKGCFLSDRVPAHSLIEASAIVPTVNAPESTRRVFGIQVSGEIWYVTMSAKGAQPSFNGDFSWPHKSELFIRRLLNGRLFFNKFNADTPSPISIQTEIGNEFCSIELKKGDRLVFSMRSLFAFSEHITFRLAVRMRAAVLLQRRFLFATATGPGTVVLLARGGNMAILPNPSDNDANIDDVIGFDLNGSVYTNARHGFIDTHFRSFTIRPASDTLVIREAPHSPWSLKVLLRRFLALLLPF